MTAGNMHAALVVLGEVGGTEAACPVRCVQAAYLTCDNHPSKQLGGCDCQCAPKDGKNCRLHFLRTGGTFNCPAQ